MKVAIVTSSLRGVASHHIPFINIDQTQICLVIYNEGVILNKKAFYLKKIKKMFKIGFFGALNGIKMRKWYNQDLESHIHFEELSSLCKSLNIPFATVKTLNSDQTKELLTNCGAELGLSLGNGYISSKIFNIPRFGMLNIHHELLPNYQNAQSVIWQLYNSSKITGFTIHKIDKNIDTGAIVLREEVDIDFRPTLGATVSATYAKLFDASAQGLIKVLKDFDSFFNNAKPQGNGNKYTTPSFLQYLRMVKNHRKLYKEFLKHSDS